MNIYTKNGDSGETSVSTGKKLSKSDALIEALGNIDELNAFLGILHTSRNKEVTKIAVDVQYDLLSLGAFLSGAKKEYDFDARTLWLEKQIDNLESKLPTLKNFIVPGGSRFSGYIHLARATCRRAERSIVKAKETHKLDEKTYKSSIKYLNRLSDLLFVMARYVNFKLGIKEIIWK